MKIHRLSIFWGWSIIATICFPFEPVHLDPISDHKIQALDFRKNLWPAFTPQQWFQPMNSPQLQTQDLINKMRQVSQIKDPIITVVGDTRATVNHLGPSALWYVQATQIKQSRPHAFIHLGDWVKRGSDIVEWKSVHHSLRLIEEIPLISLRGNHDRGGLYEQFGLSALPHFPLTMTQVGPLLIVSLDSEVDEQRAQDAVNELLQFKESRAWNEMVIKQKISFFIWTQHRPLWSGGNHGNDERNWRAWLLPALEKLEIDLFLAGHDHHYERFCKSLGSLGSRRCVAQQEKGVTYITSGGGASFTIPFPDLAWDASKQEIKENKSLRQVVSSAPHYLELSCSDFLTDQKHHQSICSQLHIQVWSTLHEGSRQLIDRLKLTSQIKPTTQSL